MMRARSRTTVRPTPAREIPVRWLTRAIDRRYRCSENARITTRPRAREIMESGSPAPTYGDMSLAPATAFNRAAPFDVIRSRATFHHDAFPRGAIGATL